MADGTPISEAPLRPFLPVLARHARQLEEDLGDLADFGSGFLFSPRGFVEREIGQLRPRLLTMVSPSAGEVLPLLSQAVETVLGHWRSAQLELVQRALTDFAAIQRAFGRPGRIKDCGAAAGDTHAGGRAVRILTFESGRRLVYKPRPMEVDLRFQSFLRWFNSLGPRFALRPLAVLGSERYGWTEFVAQESTSEPEGYYARMGSLLALLHVLGGTDIHFENVIAAGEHPVVIDLETLFHKFPRFESPRSASAAAQLELLDSVMGVGILPAPITLGGGNFLDAGALGGEIVPRAPGPKKIPSRAFLPGAELPAPVDGEAFARGYEEAVDRLRRNRAALERELEGFREVKVRLVVQGTNFYQILLRESWKPEILRDAALRAALFDSLRDRAAPALRGFVPSEIRQLEEGDVPYFSVAADETILRDPAGKSVGDLRGKTGWRISQERIEALCGPGMLESQLALVNAALGRIDPARPAPMARLRARGASGALERAVAAGDELSRSAVIRGDSATWISAGRFFPGEAANLVAPMDHTIDAGIAGVALFLAYLFRETNMERFRALARRCMVTFEEVYPPPAYRSGATDIFGGNGTRSYLYAHLGPVLGLSAPGGLGAFTCAPEGIPEREDWAYSWGLWHGVAGYGFDALLEAAPGRVPHVFGLAGPR